MKRSLTIIAFVVLSVSVFSQCEIKGRVLSSKEHKPVTDVTVTLHPKDSKAILTYAITNDNGSFVLKRETLPDSVDISVRSMTIETQTKRIKASINFVEFVVDEKITELKQVIIKAAKVRQFGDTINYNVAAFTDATDRSIADVLKKMPGIQVLSSGQILYQDKAISKFYIEGLDMLEGKYGIATNNVDASKVATVQVLENHQPIKVLKDMELPDAAAINLRLKKSAKGAFFATGQAGVGLPALLLNNELVGMRFTRKNQNLVVYKGDNTGRDVAQELVSFYGDSKVSGVNFMSVQMPPPPNIKEQHYLNNNAHTVSLNDLRVLKKNLTLTGNFNFINDKQSRNSYSKRDVFLQNEENIVIEEDVDVLLIKCELEGSLTLEGNADNYYLNNKTKFSSKWNSHSSDMFTGSENLILQNLKLPDFQASNDFKYTLKKGDKRYKMGAFLGYVTQNHSLLVEPSAFVPLLDIEHGDESLLKQNVVYDHFTTKAFFSTGLYKKLSMWFTATVFSNHHRLKSDIYSGYDSYLLTADSLRNDFAKNELGVTGTTTFMFEFTPKFKPQLSMPITYLHAKRHDKLLKSDTEKGYVLFSPLLIIQYTVTPRITIFSNISYSNNIGGISEDYRGYIMNTHRIMNRSYGVKSETRRGGGFVNLHYKNPFSSLFMSTRFSYNALWQNTLSNIHYNGMLSNITSVYHPNTVHMFNFVYSLGQSIDAIDSEVKLNTGYNRMTSEVLNQGYVSNLKSHSFYVAPSIVTNIDRFMVLKYNCQYQQTKNLIEEKEMPNVHLFTQTISTAFIPMKKLIFNVSFNHYYNNLIQSSARSSWFGNVGIKYKLKKMDLMLDWTNIFNTRRFVTYSYSDVSSYYSEYMLRPSEVLLRVRFKIL